MPRTSRKPGVARSIFNRSGSPAHVRLTAASSYAAMNANAPASRRQSKKSAGATVRRAAHPADAVPPAPSPRAHCGYGSGRHSTASTTPKIAVLAPDPERQHQHDDEGESGLMPSIRAAKRSSCAIDTSKYESPWCFVAIGGSGRPCAVFSQALRATSDCPPRRREPRPAGNSQRRRDHPFLSSAGRCYTAAPP